MPTVQHIVSQSARHATIFAELEATRQAYHALVSSLSLDDWHQPSTTPSWTIGHVLDHIALVMHAFPTDVQLIRCVGWIPRPPARLFDRVNILAVWLHAFGATPRSVRATYDAGYHRTVRTLARIRDDEWQHGAYYPAVDPFLTGFVTLERLFHYPAQHYLAHARDIRRSITHQGEH